MFGKVNEDSFQNIFDLSLDDCYDSKSMRLGLGLSNNRSSQTEQNNRTWANALLHLQDDEDLEDTRRSQPKTTSTTAPIYFTPTQIEQLQRLQRLNFNDVVPSPTSSTTSSGSGFDIPVFGQKQRNKLFDDHSDTASSSSTSSSSSSSSSSSKSAANGPNQANNNINTSRYKTELCRPFQENGVCKYGDKCQFAHGTKELRTISRHPKYKTDLCRTYHSSGFCPYGPRCHFIHNLEEHAASQSNPKQAKSQSTNQENKDQGSVPQLPMFSSCQRNSPPANSLPTPRFSQIGNKAPTPQSPKGLRNDYHGKIPASPGLEVGLKDSAPSPDGGDCSKALRPNSSSSSSSSQPRLPVFSTLYE